MGFVCEVISSCLLLNILENDGKLGLKWLNHQKKGIKYISVLQTPFKRSERIFRFRNRIKYAAIRSLKYVHYCLRRQKIE